MLNIENLKCGFGKHEILHGISLTIPKGQITAIVGQSGCGKTTFLKTLNRMVEEEGGYLSGTITLEGTDIKSLPKEKLRRRVGMVFQQPIAFPHSIEKNLSYVLKYHGVRNKKEIAEKITESLQKAKLYDEVKDQLKKSALKLSGGQKQRIGIARALAVEPEFVICDEPISALDVSIRAQVLNLLNSMKKSRGLTYLFIAHDLSVVRFISDRIAVISKGRIVELAEAEELFLHPLHPYTKALLSAVPIPDPGLEKKKKLLVYDPSCHDYSVDKPVWEEIANGHFVYGNQKELEGYRKEYQSQL